MEFVVGLVLAVLLTVVLTLFDQVLVGKDVAWWIWLIVSLVVVIFGVFIYATQRTTYPNGALMNKRQLINRVVKDTGVPPKVAASVVNSTINQIRGAVIEGESVLVAGFGSFEARGRRPRIGRNPRTGEEVRIEAKRVPFFRAALRFKEAVRTGDGSYFADPADNNWIE